MVSAKTLLVGLQPEIHHDTQRIPGLNNVTTKAEKAHLGRVAALGCGLCRLIGYGPTPAQVHHLREGQGMAQRAQHWLSIPLCEPHHTGTHGIHGDRTAFKNARVDEMDLLADTIQQLAGTAGLCE